MRSAFHPCVLALVAAAASLSLAGACRAAKADRNQPMVVEADRDGVLDLQHQALVYSGNVVISQGTMILRADRMELRTMADGYRAATALGSAAKPATWRQRRDGVDETVEGSAERIEFDGRADTLRFLGGATVRRLRGGAVADEITGASILWDNLAEVFKVEGGTTSPTNPTGRVRAVLSPRAEVPASAPMVSPLAPSRALEGRR